VPAAAANNGICVTPTGYKYIILFNSVNQTLMDILIAPSSSPLKVMATRTP